MGLRWLIVCTEAGAVHFWTWDSTKFRWVARGSSQVLVNVQLTQAALVRLAENNLGLIWTSASATDALQLSRLVLTSESSACHCAAPHLVASLPSEIRHIVPDRAGAWIVGTSGFLAYWRAVASLGGESTELLPFQVSSECSPFLMPWTGELATYDSLGICLLRFRSSSPSSTRDVVKRSLPAVPATAAFAASRFIIIYCGDVLSVYDSCTLTSSRHARLAIFLFSTPLCFDSHPHDFPLVVGPARELFRLQLPRNVEKPIIPSRSAGPAAARGLSRSIQSPSLSAAISLLSHSATTPQATIFVRQHIVQFIRSLGTGVRIETRKDGDLVVSAIEDRVSEDAPFSHCTQLNLTMLPSSQRLATIGRVEPERGLLLRNGPDDIPSAAQRSSTILRNPATALRLLELQAGVDRRALERLAIHQPAASLCLPLGAPHSMSLAPQLFRETDEEQAPLFELLCSLYHSQSPELVIPFVDAVQFSARAEGEAAPNPTEPPSRRGLSALLSASVTRPKGSAGSLSATSSSMRDMAAVLDAAGHLEPLPYLPPRLSFYHRAIRCLYLPHRAAGREDVVTYVTLLDRIGQPAAALRFMLDISLRDADQSQLYWDWSLSFVMSKSGDDPLTHPIFAELATILLQATLNSRKDRMCNMFCDVISCLPPKLSSLDFVALCKRFACQFPSLPISAVKHRLLTTADAE